MRNKITEVDNEKIVDIAKQYNREGTLWHNHFLAVKCIYNTSKKFQVVIENERSGEIYVSNFVKQPTKILRLLEDLFFNQKK
jgi:lysophospholipid acyltransferase (LPLAT)-like uncharacterized protein